MKGMRITEVIMKRQAICFGLCLMILLACFSGCSVTKFGIISTAAPVHSETGGQTQPSDLETAAPTDPVEGEFSVTFNDFGKAVVHVPGPKDPRPAYAYHFQPCVCSWICRQSLGESVEAEVRSFCDAVLRGEDSFPCTGKDNWARVHAAMHECLPLSVFVTLGGEDYDPALLRDGSYPITYTIPKDEFLQKSADFQAGIAKLIANADLREGDTDLEKALKLYTEESLRCEYDYEAYDAFKEGRYESNPYRTLMTGQGICQDFAWSYAYLLMQVGVEASVVGSRMIDDNVHAWTVLNVDDSIFYSDVTWNLRTPYALKYFGVTDEDRYHCGVVVEENDFGYYGKILHDDLQVTASRFAYDFPYVQWYRIDHDSQRLFYYDDPTFDVTNPKCYTDDLEVFELRQ